MDPEFLEHALTHDEHEAFEREGYLLVQNALTRDHVRELVDVVDRLRAGGELTDPETYAGATNRVQHKNPVDLDCAFVDLVDHPTTFPKVWGILGWNIYLYNNHLMLTPPQSEEGAHGPTGWHQDAGRTTMDMLELNVAARLSLKVGYFLTDIPRPDMGNFWMIPGSHLQSGLRIRPGSAGMVPGAQPVVANAGDALIFDRRLWHSGSPNYSSTTRQALFYAYAYRWVRPYDSPLRGDPVLAATDPIRRQLLDTIGDEVGPYEVTDETVPLRAWLAEHQPDVAARYEYGVS